jgi:LPXTG-motif cell wall-anchored protein
MTAQPTARPTEAGVRGRALLAALGLALAAAVLPATAAHASPQSPDIGNQLTNPGGNPPPPQPPDPPQVGPEDLANPIEDPEPPLPPDPPDAPDWGPDDLANPTENPDPPLPPNPDPVSTTGDSIPTPQRVDAGFGGTATGSHQAAGLALIGAALVLTLLVLVIARRRHAEARSNR